MYSQFFHVSRTVRCLEWKGNDFKIGLSTFDLIVKFLGQKYIQKSTLLTKLVPVMGVFFKIRAKPMQFVFRIKPPTGSEPASVAQRLRILTTQLVIQNSLTLTLFVPIFCRTFTLVVLLAHFDRFETLFFRTYCEFY